MKVTAGEECGNSPRKLILKEFNVALASGDLESVVSRVSEDIAWNLVGSQVVRGKEAFEKALGGSTMKVAHLVIENIITHGKTAAVNGELELDNGYRLAFCDVYGFESAGKQAKIDRITAYVVSA